MNDHPLKTIVDSHQSKAAKMTNRNIYNQSDNMSTGLSWTLSWTENDIWIEDNSSLVFPSTSLDTVLTPNITEEFSYNVTRILNNISTLDDAPVPPEKGDLVLLSVWDNFSDATVSDESLRSPWPEDMTIQNLTLAMVLIMFCIITIFGNVLVMVAVARERYLHTVTNYFIVSLATADCLVGALVMPFSAVHEVMNKVWLFGQDWCDVWHSVDVLGSTASILNLCVISMDRYWAITDPISYPSRMTNRRACLWIAFVWVCSSLISFPAIAWWRQVGPVNPEPYTCNFTEDVGYVVFSSIISFYGPLSVMLFTYFRIYRAAAAQTRSLRLGTKQVLACNGEEAMELTLRIHRGGGSGGGHRAHSDDSDSRTSALLGPDGLRASSVRIVPKNLKHFSFSRKLAKIAKEQKAAKTLGIVVGVFVLCWLPFFVTSILTGICATDCIYEPELVYSVVTWLGWINSGMNPVIYACWSRDFRRAFTKILCSCCPGVMNKQYRHRLRGKVCHMTNTTVSSSCSTECVKL